MDISGKVAIVTGGNSGLGEATARALMKAGARVISFDRAGSAPEGAEFAECDIASDTAIKAAVDKVIADHGAVQILVNCAGVPGLGQIATPDGPGDMAAFRRVVDVNLIGTAAVTAEVAHRMISNDPSGPEEERGIIINTCSIASFAGQEAMGAYTASKAALAALCLVWARDLSRHNIRCMGIAPGFFFTGMTAGMPEPLLEDLLKNYEFPRRGGRPEEFAELALFIIRSPMLNGDVVRIDSGTRPPARTLWTTGG